MKYSALTVSALLASVCARPDANANSNARSHARDLHVQRREVPQEHSHQKFITTTGQMLNLNNPAGIKDPIFGLLGNAAGSAGQGSISNTDCLQQATADQAFTNAKAAGNVDGMTAALIYRALERNTGKVGLASVPCTAIKAVNPEIAAIQQHQDPASANAAQINHNIVINLAKQIASIGGDPTLALQSGTFAPGNPNDATGKGNSCDDQNDAQGCIFTQKLLVEDATVAEIMSAVAGTGKSGTGNTAAAAKKAGPTTTQPAAAATGCNGAASPPAAPPAGQNQVTNGASSSAAATGASGLNFGSCANPSIVFGPGFDGRKENSFEPADTKTFTHGSALNIKVITDFICQQLQVKCGASQSAITACNNGAAAAQAEGGKDQGAADAFNAALGFGSAGTGAGSPAAPTAAAPTTAATAKAAPTTGAGAANSASGSTPSTGAAGGALNFGSCPDPSIIFGPGFDGRKENSFKPKDTTAFTHGSAQNIKVITDFICQQLGTKCGANAAALTACQTGAAAAQAEGGKDQGAADAFNKALGV